MELNDDQSQHRTDSTSSHRRVTVPEAARILGISPEAVRARIQRGTLIKEKDTDGTVYVQLDANRTRSNGKGKPDARHSALRPNGAETAVEGAIVEVLQDQITFLRNQLDQEREANRENRRIIAGLVQRVPELEGTIEQREASETVSEDAGKEDVSSEPQGASERRSWLHRFFFGPES